MQQQTARRLLAWLLYVLGGMMSVAFLAVIMQVGMAVIADWLGVGPLQRSPLTEYLTRSLSAMYGVLGVLHLYLARDVVRYLDLIVVIGWLTVLAGAIQTVVDFAAGMPPFWSWSEGPPTVLAGLAYIWLAKGGGGGGGGSTSGSRLIIRNGGARCAVCWSSLPSSPRPSPVGEQRWTSPDAVGRAGRAGLLDQHRHPGHARGASGEPRREGHATPTRNSRTFQTTP